MFNAHTVKIEEKVCFLGFIFKEQVIYVRKCSPINRNWTQ